METEQEHRDLLDRCIKGDRRAWNTLVERFTRYVYYLIQLTAKKYTTDLTQEEVADLHNDLFVALMEDDCRRLRAFEGKNGCSVRSWIRIITIRKTLDALRKRRNHLSIDDTDSDSPPIHIVDDGPNPLEAMMAKAKAEQRAQLSALTEGLSEGDRLLLEMIYVQKLSATAIASALKLKKGAVYTRKTRLIQRLRQAAESRGLVDTDDSGPAS